jgi:hypothetical protein
MKKLLLVVALFSGLMFFSCGEKVDDLKTVAEVIQKAPEVAANIEKSSKEAEIVKAERKKRNDVGALPYAKLQTYLITKLDGYKAEEPSGETIDMQGLSYSNASITFNKTNSDGTEDFIEINILDYNSVETMFTAAAYWVGGITKEDTRTIEKSLTTNIPYTYGSEKYLKDTKEVELNYAVAYRFIVQIRGNNQKDTEFLKSIASKMKLAELAKL